MNKLFLVFLFFIIAFSCKKKNETATGYQWPEGTGEYAPYTLGSTFVYQTTTTTPASIDSFTYTVTKDTTIDGLKFKKLESNKPLLASTFYSNYNSNLRTDITYNTVSNGITVPVIKQVVLKDNVNAGTNWTESLNVTVPTIPVPIPITFTYTDVQTNFTKTVLAVDYTGTIDVKQVAALPPGITLPPGTPSSVTIENYYSKGVGMSQRDATNTNIQIKRFNVIK